MATRAELARRLAEYKTAESAILKNQEYSVENVTYRRANLSVVRDHIERLERALAGIDNGGGMRTRRIIFRDD